MTDPSTTYENRLSERQNQVEQAKASYIRLGNARLAYAAFAVAAIWIAAAFGFRAWPALALAAAAILVALLMWGERLERRTRFAERGVTYYERALERVRGRRNEHGETGERFLDANHPYAFDLDLFGKHSLFQLLSVCRTRAGENVLAQWLRAPASREEILSRHGAIADLRDRLDLREDLAVLGEDFRSGVHPEALAQWGLAEPIRIPNLLRWIAGALSALGLILLVAWTATQFADRRLRIALLLVAAVEASFFFRWRAAVNHIAVAVEEPGHDLALLSSVLARLEKEQFESPRLQSLHRAFSRPRQASVAIVQLRRLIELLESRDNLFLRVFGPLILWTTQVSFAVETWRQRHGKAIPGWLDAVAEIEAIHSLAAATFEQPGDVFPEIVSGEAVFEAKGLAHPLLAECVPNDVALGFPNRLWIVSGSNMSGKSTLLRTVGANAVLALAGGVVRATSLRLSPLSIAASIRTSDSLEGGISRFYAEILRLRQILDLPQPALFLLDELLAGTNSHDRRIGAEAILRSLLQRGAMGFATTHDLALAAIAEALPGASNVHFEDSIRNGEISFDYHMRPGVVTRSNALELMRSIGLEI